MSNPTVCFSKECYFEGTLYSRALELTLSSLYERVSGNSQTEAKAKYMTSNKRV
jgi:hypothetical protein